MNVLYFASLKESLNMSSEEIKASSNMTTGELKLHLIQKHGVHHFPKNIICAVNHEVRNDLALLSDNDEVAFFPPVTGG
ncbi:MAG TPA: molybdopterin converting factor subunit 1 [Candidatus Thioglobus sp.]|jgi:molybdopterin synthase sulfur carrier subunit|nr:molybdopterin converting factor subunit 1 [Candidatus Thioglobus sp.]HIL42168.1 molybdopterin converting factor subunit 1 [Gammaproteobacteria bacterium]